MILLVLALLVAAFAVGTWAWRAPGIGLIGSLGGYAPGWLVVSGVTISAVALTRLAAVSAAAAGVLGCFTAVSGVYFLADQWRAHRRHGVATTPWDYFALLPRSQRGPDDTVTYGPVGGRTHRMAIYRPQPGESPAPVVFFVHGGAWADGNEASDTAFLRPLADRGFLVFSATYTLATDDLPTWNIVPREVAAAMATAFGLAEQYSGSSKRFYVSGTSAGGQLATLVANRVSAGDDFGGGYGVLPRIDAVAVNIAAVDPALDNPYWKVRDLVRRIRTTFVGGEPDQFPERYSQLASANFLHPDAPPTLLVYGPNDWLVPCQGSLDYARRAEQLGVAVTSVPIPWTGHLIGLSGAARRAIIQLTAEWFDEHAT